MKIITPQEIAQVINLLPPNSEAAQSILTEWMAENSVDRQPYTYEVDFATTIVQGSTNVFAAPLAAGANTVVGTFLVDASAPFMLVSSTYQSDVAGAAVTVSTRPAPNQVVLITDQASNRRWMNGPVPVPSIFGIGTLPYIWPQQKLIPGNTTIQIEITNYDAASVPNTRLSFHGYRLYFNQSS